MVPIRWVNLVQLTAKKDPALRYPVPGTILAGTGFEKMAGYPANRNQNRISGTSLHTGMLLYVDSYGTLMTVLATKYQHNAACQYGPIK